MDLTKKNYAIFILEKELETIRKRLAGDVIVDFRFKEEIKADKIKVKQLKRSIDVLESSKLSQDAFIKNEVAVRLNQHCDNGIVDKVYGENIYCDLCRDGQTVL